MQQIGRHWPSSAPPGDYQALCSYCGSPWRRSQLRRDGAGNLMCPDDEGLDSVTLDRMNREMGPNYKRYLNDARTETKVTETAPDLAAIIGHVTF